MTKSTRARYTLEFKEEAVRLVTSGERVATVAKNLGLSEQTLHNWVKAASNGGLKSSATPAVSPSRAGTIDTAPRLHGASVCQQFSLKTPSAPCRWGFSRSDRYALSGYRPGRRRSAGV